MDRKTYTEADFNFTDVTAQEDSHPASTSAKDFSDMELFHKEDVRQAPYGTLELNQFVLDGSRTIFTETIPDVPYWSDEMSNEHGLYAKNPTIEIAFTKNHSSIGLSLYFAEDIPAEIHIIWYTLYGTKLYEKTFYPDKAEYFCECQVANYGKVVIEAVRSSFPYRYMKLNHIQYGRLWHLGRDNIKTASILEELDVTGATLSINTATVDIIDADGNFDTTNTAGLWKSLQKEQPIQFTEYIDGSPVDCGIFYLDDWSSQKNIVKFKLVDAIGIMDKTKFYDGRIYEQELAGNIIAEIMESCGMAYEIDDAVSSIPLSGWIAIQSHRAALQQVIFACGAVADCSRSELVKIYKPDRHISRTIGINRKFTGTKITFEKYISSVTVAYHQYLPSEEEKEISKNVLPVGVHRVEFGAPYQPSGITVSAGNIQEVCTNYIVVEMTEECECRITGKGYERIENAATASLPVIDAGENENAKTYKGCTLLDAVQAKKMAEELLSYHQLRQIVNMRYINNGEGVGNWCDVGFAGGKYATTCITSQTLDLTGGNLANAKCRGYYSTVTSFYFCGNELYAGGEGII